MRHIRNFRRNPRGRPHSGHRLWARTRNFGFRNAFSINDVFATTRLPRVFQFFRNGIPIADNSAKASSSVRAVVTTVTFIPLNFSTLS